MIFQSNLENKIFNKIEILKQKSKISWEELLLKLNTTQCEHKKLNDATKIGNIISCWTGVGNLKPIVEKGYFTLL
jgi:hypothetical protein